MIALRVLALLALATDASAAAIQVHSHLRNGQPLGQPLSIGQPLSPAPAPVGGGPAAEEDPDRLAMDTFIRKCTVALSVRSSEMLPTDALRNFCESTDAVMECRLKLLEPLKEAHRKGGSMMVFCATAYNWFQHKYGMYCPTQCHKMQCRSTCGWLEEKKALDWEGEKLEESQAAVAGSRKELDELQGELEDAREAAEMRNRSVAQEQVNFARANATLQEKLSAYQWQANASSQVDVTVTSLEQRKEVLALNVTSAEDVLAELKMRVEKADLATHLLNDERRRLSGKAGEAEARLTDLQHQHAKSEEEARVLEQMMNEEEAKARDTEREVANATAEVNNRRQKHESAGAQLDAAKADPNETQAEIRELQNLERQQKQRFHEAKEAFRVLDREHASQRIGLEHSRQDLSGYRSRNAALSNETDVQQRVVVGLEEQLVAKDMEVDAGNNASDVLKAEASNRTAELAKLRDQAGTAGRSLELQRSHQRAEHGDLENAQSALQRARDEAATQEAELGQELTALATAASKLREVLEKEMQEKSRWEAENGGLVSAIAAHKTKARDLEHRRPDIVRMHGLGLVQLLD